MGLWGEEKSAATRKNEGPGCPQTRLLEVARGVAIPFFPAAMGSLRFERLRRRSRYLHDGLGNCPLKPALTIATTCSNTAFLFFAVGDSGLSRPWYSSACSSISCSLTWINTIRPSSPNRLCSN